MSNDPQTIFRLDGRVALVTGSSKGLGRAMAMALGKAGAKVCINYFNNKAKADAEVSMGRDVEVLTLAAAPATRATLEGVASDVLAAARVASHAFESRDGLEEGTFDVVDIRFAPKPEKKSKD